MGVWIPGFFYVGSVTLGKSLSTSVNQSGEKGTEWRTGIFVIVPVPFGLLEKLSIGAVGRQVQRKGGQMGTSGVRWKRQMTWKIKKQQHFIWGDIPVSSACAS